jgi:hypothetical protein
MVWKCNPGSGTQLELRLAYETARECAMNEFPDYHPLRLELFERYAKFLLGELPEEVEWAGSVLSKALPPKIDLDSVPPESKDVVFSILCMGTQYDHYRRDKEYLSLVARGYTGKQVDTYP